MKCSGKRRSGGLGKLVGVVLRRKPCVSRTKRKRSRSESRDPVAIDCGVGEFWPLGPGSRHSASKTRVYALMARPGHASGALAASMWFSELYLTFLTTH